MFNNILVKKAFILAIITVFYNIVEGIISVIFGLQDDTLALFGFGVDSFVEVFSGLGIVHLVLRMNISEIKQRDKFERLALKITGTGFYILSAGLLFGALFSILTNQKPETTFAGIIISVISIFTMYFLMKAKLRTGKALNSEAIISDAACTKTCLYLSIVLLLSSGLYELFNIGFIDALGSITITWFSFSEGKEAFEKSRSNKLSCNCH